jgi:hypothetical protein
MPRIETITRTLYTFDELSDTAKQKAVEQLSDINVDHVWWEGVYEDANQVGITITSFDLDRSRHACADIDNTLFTTREILDQHGPDCETYKTAKTFNDAVQPLINKLEKAEDINNRYYGNPHTGKLPLRELTEQIRDLKDTFKRDITEDYSIILQKEYEYLIIKEAIIETIEADGYEFLEDGTPA